MKPQVNPPGPPTELTRHRIFAGLFGALIGLALLKFGNPVVLAPLIDQPKDGYEWAIMAWPLPLAYPLLITVAVVGLFCVEWRSVKWRWPLWLPLGWLGWQLVASTHSLDPALSEVTLQHFGACVLCFLLGWFCLGRVRSAGALWLGILCGFVAVLAVGLEQHFGGLEATRRQFQIYVYPTLQEVPAEYLKRMNSNRIFSTLFYPNALAGVLLLLLPPVLVVLWQAERWLTKGARLLVIAMVASGAVACLYWSGSKGGWLLVLLLSLIALLHLRFGKRWKVVLVAGMLVAGLAGFSWRYAGFFERGATSVSARFDYWRAALQTAGANPILGTGPGTFGRAYGKIKRPESEMSRVTHNDYLQQASDSGLPGFLAYLGLVAAALVCTCPRRRTRTDWLHFAVWLGLLGWSLQGIIEFGLYIPALAWPAFTFMGWLWSQSPANGIDKRAAGV